MGGTEKNFILYTEPMFPYKYIPAGILPAQANYQRQFDSNRRYKTPDELNQWEFPFAWQLPPGF